MTCRLVGKPEDINRVLRQKEDGNGGTKYVCRICGLDLTDAVAAHGRAGAEAHHKFHHYKEIRERILKYAEDCYEYTKRNPKKADMTKYMLLIGAVADLKQLERGQ